MNNNTMKNTILTLLTLLMLSSFTSCSKDDDVQVESEKLTIWFWSIQKERITYQNPISGEVQTTLEHWGVFVAVDSEGTVYDVQERRMGGDATEFYNDYYKPSAGEQFNLSICPEAYMWEIITIERYEERY
jgi:hypothetical protein